MKKVDKNFYVTVAIVIVLIVAVASIVNSCSAGNKFSVQNGSEMRASTEHVYYNNSKNDIYKMNMETMEAELFKEDYTLLDVTDNEILVEKGSDVFVLDSVSGEVVLEAKDLNVTDACVTEEDIFYTNEKNLLFRMKRETGESASVPMMENIYVEDFEVYDKADIFFTSETDRVIRYNPDTGLMLTYAEQIKVIDFTVNDGYLLYIDETDNNSIYAIDLDTNSAVRFKDIQALRLEYKNGTIFYFDKEDGNKARYDIKTLESKLPEK